MCMKDGAALMEKPSEDTFSGQRPVAAADHHMHIQSEAVSQELRRLAVRLPDMFARLSPALFETRGGQDALKVLDEAGIAEGVLLSEAYMFTSAFASPELEDPARLTREENLYNVEAALASKGRLKAFIGINPFSDIAIEELEYWRSRPGVAGVKLHLANSGFDPTLSSHFTQLAGFVAAAREAGLPLLIHAAHAGAYEKAHTERFIREVLSQASGITIQIAHGGGGGGLSETTLLALEAYAEAIEAGAPGTDQLFIDLSVVLVSDTGSEESQAYLARFAALARRMGLARFLTGSDWPSLCPPVIHDTLQMSQIPFTHAEWTGIAANRAPYLREKA